MYGQFNEVKILNKLTKSFNIPKTCIEFGAHDGITNSNTFIFGKKEISALLIEPDLKLFTILKKNANSLCTLVNEFVSKENNLNKIIKKYKFPKNWYFIN